ncbi:hypothetical protein CEXT_589171 [Caerostris extrusa]|uniref:Uncharacterized protein n=1 Tax=Caerostris extrusa TaxID=172846 RepID=A0AAV4TBC1_CAEEX|nr:hypothetical protein CEXT_589171 [Caerostris extrusa]
MDIDPNRPCERTIRNRIIRLRFGREHKPRSPLKSPNTIIIAVHRNCNRNPSFARPSDGHRSKSPLRAHYPQSHYPTSIRSVIVRTGLFDR